MSAVWCPHSFWISLMRKLLYLVPVAGAVGFLLYSWYFASEGSHSLLARAITAHGGEANLDKSRIGIIKGTGKKAGDHFLIPYTWEEAFDSPGRFKRVSKRGLVQTSTMTELFRDGKVWGWIDDQKPMVRNAEQPPYLCIAFLLGQLVKIHEENIPLRSLGEVSLLDRPAVGIEANSKVWGKVELYFDKESYLLLKLHKKLEGPDGSEGAMETICSGYKDHQ